jgi:hypothetical protein
LGNYNPKGLSLSILGGSSEDGRALKTYPHCGKIACKKAGNLALSRVPGLYNDYCKKRLAKAFGHGAKHAAELWA